MITEFHDELLNYAEDLGFGDLHIKLDKESGLCAIIAIHSTKRGPALGGCRFIEYTSIASAVIDALRLAQGMSYKAAITELPLGGGKAVVIKPKNVTNREALFSAFGRFVNEMGGRYITAMDSGTETTDMEIISRHTPYVTTLARENGDPAPYTALGVLRGQQAAIKLKLGKDNFEGLHVAIQGVGHVGYNLAKLLHERGAKLTICDRNPDAALRCVNEFGAQKVELEDVYAVESDIFAPCALGAILNEKTIPHLKAKIIAGAANNQLGEAKDGQRLCERGILYAPDYVINSGGLIHALAEYQKSSEKETLARIDHIYDVMLNLFERAHHEQKTTNEIADVIAAERLK